jgi:hypothetical protein
MREDVSAHLFARNRLPTKVSSDIIYLPTGTMLWDGSIQVLLNSAQSINRLFKVRPPNKHGQ